MDDYPHTTSLTHTQYTSLYSNKHSALISFIHSSIPNDHFYNHN